ncbi:MAG: metallophosphoesterase family protein [Salibacteraceae bacterium]
MLTRLISLLSGSILLLTIVSCDKFEYSVFEVSDLKYQNINLANIERLPQSNDTFRIAVIGDTQRFYGQSEDVVDLINKNPDIDFVVHTGDLVDFGVQREYEWMHEVLAKLNAPYIAVIGNHDLIGNGDILYKEMYGQENFSFLHGHTKFIYINTNSREYNFPGDVPNISWLDSELADSANYKQAIIVCHVSMKNVDFNEDLKDPFNNTLSKYGKTLMGINGHNHGFDTSYTDGIFRLNSSSTSEKKYVELTIWEGGYNLDLVE